MPKKFFTQKLAQYLILSLLMAQFLLFVSGGEDVMMAGAIKPGTNPNELIVTNKTGHFKVGPGDETSVVNELKSMGYNVEVRYDSDSLR